MTSQITAFALWFLALGKKKEKRHLKKRERDLMVLRRDDSRCDFLKLSGIPMTTSTSSTGRLMHSPDIIALTAAVTRVTEIQLHSRLWKTTTQETTGTSCTKTLQVAVLEHL